MPNKKLRLQIITPQRPVLDKLVDFVALPAYKGEMGILPGHIQYLAQLNFGVLRYKAADGVGTFAVMGGIAEIENDNVSVFAEDAALEDEIDIEEEKQRLAKARATLSRRDSELDMELAEMEIKKAILLLRVKEKSQR